MNDHEYKDTIFRLRDWIRRSDYSQQEFAKMLGLNKGSLSHYIHDRKDRKMAQFSFEQALRIETITNGAFTAEDLMARQVPKGWRVKIRVDPSNSPRAAA